MEEHRGEWRRIEEKRLAGGLRAENVRAAIEAVEPFGLDLCSGVRPEGKLDPRKLDAFFRAAGY